MSTFFTDKDNEALEILLAKKRKAEEEERQRKEQEVQISKEIFNTFNETIKQLQGVIMDHEQQISETATKYGVMLPGITLNKSLPGKNDGYKDKYDDLKT